MLLIFGLAIVNDLVNHLVFPYSAYLSRTRRPG